MEKTEESKNDLSAIETLKKIYKWDSWQDHKDISDATLEILWMTKMQILSKFGSFP